MRSIPNPDGLCMCGCGQATPIAKRTRQQRGQLKGYPTPLCPGHHLPRPYPPIEKRFRTKFVEGAPDECWEWQGTRDAVGGYGMIRTKTGSLGAHRLAYQLAYGPILPGLAVCHSCDNRLCVNPNHLFLGTAGDNMRDRTAKGRAAKGEQNGRAKLTAPQVRAIRELHAAGASLNSLAKRFGVGRPTITGIVRGTKWVHV